MNEIKCSECVRFKTQYCPCTIDCMATDDYPYFQDKRMMLEENQQLKEQLLKREIELNDCMNERNEFVGIIEKTIFKLSELAVSSTWEEQKKISKVINLLEKYKGDNNEGISSL